MKCKQTRLHQVMPIHSKPGNKNHGWPTSAAIWNQRWFFLAAHPTLRDVDNSASHSLSLHVHGRSPSHPPSCLINRFLLYCRQTVPLISSSMLPNYGPFQSLPPTPCPSAVVSSCPTALMHDRFPCESPHPPPEKQRYYPLYPLFSSTSHHFAKGRIHTLYQCKSPLTHSPLVILCLCFRCGCPATVHTTPHLSA